jgi:hypothetical protein
MTAEAFGHGLVCPFQRDGRGDFAHDGGLTLLRSDLRELLGILGPEGAQPGELPWRMDLGSRLVALKHRGMHRDMIRALAEGMTAGSVRRWYSEWVRVGSTRITSETTSDGGTLTVDFTYYPTGLGQSDAERLLLALPE